MLTYLNHFTQEVGLARVVGYLRVSTDQQAQDGGGLEVQKAAIRKWARTNGHRIVAITSDEGISGAKELVDRPGLGEALALVRARKADGIVVYRLDRLARDLVLQETLLAEVKRLGGRVFSTAAAEDDFLADDPTDPSRRLIRQVLGAVAEYERSLISLRLRSGRDRKHADGGYAGFGSPPLGWCAVDGELVPDDEEQATVARIRELRHGGASLREIVAALDEGDYRTKRGARWHINTVARVLRRAAANAA